MVRVGFLWFLFPVLVHGQNVLSLSPGAAGGSFGSIRTVHDNILSMYGNKAGTALMTSTSVYGTVERRFQNSDLNFYSLVAAHPGRFGTFGASIFYHGFEDYRESSIGFSYGRKLLDVLSLGMQLNLVQISIPGYGKTAVPSLDIGVLSNVSPGVHLGFYMQNPLEIQVLHDEVIPATFALGVSYLINEKVLLGAEVEKRTGFSENIKMGLEYRYLKQLSFRFGINTKPSLVTFGVGYRLESGLMLDLASSVHQELGLSPIASFGYNAQ